MISSQSYSFQAKKSFSDANDSLWISDEIKLILIKCVMMIYSVLSPKSASSCALGNALEEAHEAL